MSAWFLFSLDDARRPQIRRGRSSTKRETGRNHVIRVIRPEITGSTRRNGVRILLCSFSVSRFLRVGSVASVASVSFPPSSPLRRPLAAPPVPPDQRAGDGLQRDAERNDEVERLG